MTPFVKLAVVRQKGFRHDPEQPAAMDCGRAVVEPAAMGQWRADDKARQQLAAGLDQQPDLRRDRVEHRVLQQQIVDRVSR